MKTFAVLGGDMRQTYLVRQLRGAGFAVHSFCVPQLEPDAACASDCVRGSDALLLPMPALCAPDTIRAAPDGIPLTPVLDAAAPGTVVCGGMLELLQTAAKRRGLRTVELAQDAALLLENAELTAEGALSELLARLHRPLAGSQILIIGYGRIGKLLARKLHALGAAVTVTARAPQDAALASIVGLHCERTGLYEGGLGQYDAICSTVPATVLHEAQLAAVQPACVLLELASPPGGFCAAAAEHPGYCVARGLPGRCAPQAAAACIFRAVSRALRLEECL